MLVYLLYSYMIWCGWCDCAGGDGGEVQTDLSFVPFNMYLLYSYIHVALLPPSMQS